MQTLKKILSYFSKKEKVIYGIAIFAEITVIIVTICAIASTVRYHNETPGPTYITSVPTQFPTATPTVTPTPTMTPSPTCTPTPVPTSTPTPSPTLAPSKAPVSKGYSPGKPGVYECETNGKHTFKPYTDFRAYTARSSQQYKLQQQAYTNDIGIRVIKDADGIERMCIALGTAWAGGRPNDIGRCVDVYMKNGNVLYCVLADVKKVEDAINNRYGRINNDLLEFIVETGKLPQKVRTCGNVSYAGEIFMGEGMYMHVHDYFIPGFGG